MSSQNQQFPAASRLLHWIMAAMVLAMLFIGVGMVVSLRYYHVLVSIHRPLGIAILVLVLIRFANRLWNPPPPFPAHMPRAERLAATVSEYTLYGLMFLLPVVGWAMLSAARYPIVLFGPVHLPAIFSGDPAAYTWLRKLHTALAYLLFALFIGHFGAVLTHSIVLRDGLLSRMGLFRKD